MLYEWLKALHIIAVIAWMAGMLYLPRLFVYHADVPAASDRSVMLKVMERRLLKAIINPAMGFAWIFGLHDRPWQRRKIFGTVRYQSENSLRKFDAKAYLASVERLCAAEA